MSETNHVKYYSYSFFILIDLHSPSNLNKSIPHPSFIPPVLFTTCPLYHPSYTQPVLYTTRPIHNLSFIPPVLHTTCPLYHPSYTQPVLSTTSLFHNPFFIPPSFIPTIFYTIGIQHLYFIPSALSISFSLYHSSFFQKYNNYRISVLFPIR